MIEVLAGTPAALADLRPGDRIVAFDGQPIRSHHDLTDRLDRIPAGKPITLGVVRGEDPRRTRIDLPLRTASRPGPSPAGSGPTATPPGTTSTRASVPVTPTASRATPPIQGPATPVPTSPPNPPDASPAHDAAPGPGATRSSQPADPDHMPADRVTPATPTDRATPSTGSFNDLRLNLPRAFVERIEQLERRLEKLETFSPPSTRAPTPGPGTPPRRPVDSVRTP